MLQSPSAQPRVPSGKMSTPSATEYTSKQSETMGLRDAGKKKQVSNTPKLPAASVIADLQFENDDLRSALTAAMGKLATAVSLMDASSVPSPFYVVEFGTAAIGMILTITDKLEVKVVDMRCDSSGRPLAALASGKIAVGDIVLAVNGTPLMSHRTLESVAEEFRRAKRPAQVLFQRCEDTCDDQE